MISGHGEARAPRARRTFVLAVAWMVQAASCAPHPSRPAGLDHRSLEGAQSSGAAGEAGVRGDAGSSTTADDARAADSGRSNEGHRTHLPGQLSFLVITVDTLRPDLGCMGYNPAVSPHIDKLAERAVVYENAYSVSTYTGFCLPPMMASRYPSEMPRTDRHEVKYFKENVMLAERLRDAGYHTAGAASHFLFAPELGWIDGFERFARVQGEGDAPPGAGIDRLHSSRGLADAAIRLLSDARVTSGPFFIWVHFLDPHKKYLEHPGFSNFGSDPRGLYDGEIAYTDFHIGRVLDALAASPVRDHTAVVLTADHGEAFGEHGEFFHGSEVWDEIVRVPLLVTVPGSLPRRLARRMSSVELAPTILELAGLPEDPGARGKSFAAELFGGEALDRPILIDQPHNPYYENRRAFIDGNYKLHHYPEAEKYLLFDLARDPGELRDLAVSDPEVLRRVQGSYDAFMSTVAQVTPRPVVLIPAKPGSH